MRASTRDGAPPERGAPEAGTDAGTGSPRDPVPTAAPCFPTVHRPRRARRGPGCTWSRALQVEQCSAAGDAASHRPQPEASPSPAALASCADPESSVGDATPAIGPQGADRQRGGDGQDSLAGGGPGPWAGSEDRSRRDGSGEPRPSAQTSTGNVSSGRSPEPPSWAAAPTRSLRSSSLKRTSTELPLHKLPVTPGHTHAPRASSDHTGAPPPQQHQQAAPSLSPPLPCPPALLHMTPHAASPAAPDMQLPWREAAPGAAPAPGGVRPPPGQPLLLPPLPALPGLQDPASTTASPAAFLLPQGMCWSPSQGSKAPHALLPHATMGGPALSMLPLSVPSMPGALGAGSAPGGAHCLMLDSRMLLPPGSSAAAEAAAFANGRVGFQLVFPYPQNRRAAAKGKGPGTGRRACGCPARMCKCGACPPKPANARRQKGKGPGTGRRACGCPSRRCSCGAAALAGLPQVPVLVPVALDLPHQQLPGQISFEHGQYRGEVHPAPPVNLPQQQQQQPLNFQQLHELQHQHQVLVPQEPVILPLPQSLQGNHCQQGHGAAEQLFHHDAKEKADTVVPGGGSIGGHCQEELWRGQGGLGSSQEGQNPEEADEEDEEEVREVAAASWQHSGDPCTDLSLGHSLDAGCRAQSSSGKHLQGCGRGTWALMPSPSISCSSKLSGETEEVGTHGQPGGEDHGSLTSPLKGHPWAEVEASGEDIQKAYAEEPGRSYPQCRSKRLLFAPAPTGDSETECAEEAEAHGTEECLLKRLTAPGERTGRGGLSSSSSNSSSSSSWEGGSGRGKRVSREGLAGDVKTATEEAVREIQCCARTLAMIQDVAHGRDSPLLAEAPQSVARVRSAMQRLHQLTCVPVACSEVGGLDGDKESTLSACTVGSQSEANATCRQVSSRGFGDVPPALRCGGACGRFFHPECIPGHGGGATNLLERSSAMQSSGALGSEVCCKDTEWDDTKGAEPGAGRGFLCLGCRAWAHVFHAMLDLLVPSTLLSVRKGGPHEGLHSSSSSNNLLPLASAPETIAGPLASSGVTSSWPSVLVCCSLEDLLPRDVSRKWLEWAKGTGLDASLKPGLDATTQATVCKTAMVHSEIHFAFEMVEGATDGAMDVEEEGRKKKSSALLHALYAGAALVPVMPEREKGQSRALSPPRHDKQLCDAGARCSSSTCTPATPPLSAQHRHSTMSAQARAAPLDGSIECLARAEAWAHASGSVMGSGRAWLTAAVGSQACSGRSRTREAKCRGAPVPLHLLAGPCTPETKGETPAPAASAVTLSSSWSALGCRTPPLPSAKGTPASVAKGGEALELGDLCLPGTVQRGGRQPLSHVICLSPGAKVPSSPNSSPPSNAVVLLSLSTSASLQTSSAGRPTVKGGQPQHIALIPMKGADVIPQGSGAHSRGLKRSSTAVSMDAEGGVGYVYCYYVPEGHGSKDVAAAVAAVPPLSGAATSTAMDAPWDCSPRRRRRKQMQPKSSAELELAC